MAGTSALLVSAIGLGIAYCAAPGAVNTEAVRRGLARGFRPVLLVQLGSLIGDAIWAALALTGTAFLVQHRPLRLVLGIAGACFLLRLAWSALQEAWRGGLPRAHGQTGRGDFATGIVFSLANPFALAFWTGIGAGFATMDTGGSSSGRFAVLFAGFVVGALCWCASTPFVIAWGRRFVRPAVFRWINALCGLGLGYFGLTLLWHTAADFLGQTVNEDI
ncbi:MAG: LysE family translocator [Chloroflexota bacterium]|nr:LysE family translocator [Chloroflexota bacterium]